MGSEATCAATFAGKTAEGKALLETDELVFRAPGMRLRLAFKDLTRVEADAHHLRVVGPEGEVALALGPVAARWAEKIRNPPSLLDKLGIREGTRVSALRIAGEDFLAQLATSGADVSTRARKSSDVLLVGVESRDELARIAEAARSLAPAGGLWVVYPKGRSDLKETEIMAAGKRAGLVDNKTARFSATHTALRFVIPAARRPASAKATKRRA